jgi:hypothetical protein
MYTSNPKLDQLASRNLSFERQPEKLIEIYETMTALVKAHLERESSAGQQTLTRSIVLRLVFSLFAIAFVGCVIYFTFSSLSFSHSGWLTVLVTYCGIGAILAFIDRKVPFAGFDRAVDSNVKDVSASITAHICETFPDRKAGHLATDFLQLWGAKAFYDAAPWFKFFHPSKYFYLVVGTVYDQLSERSSEQLRQRDRSSGRLQPQPAEVASATPSPQLKPQSDPPAGSIACSHCGHFFSPRATNCPVCGEPSSRGFFHVNRLTGERTSKAEKLTGIAANLVLAATLIALPVDLLLFSGSHFFFIILLIVASVCFRLYLRVGHWWHHG